ncbi:MAG TPA: sialidase family protein [Gemmatimonadaceae bacterium]|jgi:hypothetical protein|nr:sialidase family protein [Gemmatimonadaceae bacterium]
MQISRGWSLARAAVVILVAGAACAGPAPVAWQDATVIAASTPPAAQVAFDSAGGVTFAVRPVPPGAPDFPAACRASIRFAQDEAGTWYAAWWAVRPDSSAGLWASRSDDGGRTWLPPHIVDSTDVGVTGCTRAPPSIAASGDYVHLAYSMHAREGAGVFFAHSMDRGGLFHTPVPIAYGQHPNLTSIAAHGDRVVVAYEDPNGEEGRVGLAISATMGHIFEAHVQVSGNNGDAVEPEVALHDTHVAVSWTERAGVNGTGPSARLLRVGVLQ